MNIATCSIVVILILIICIIVLSELDRHYGGCTEKLKAQYLENPGRMFLGALNSIIRLTNSCPPFPSMNEHFPEHVEFLAMKDKIKEEALRVYNDMNLPSMAKLDESFKDIADERWKTFVMMWYNGLTSNAQYAPFTSALCQKYGNKIKAAMFSVLGPGQVIIPPHKGPCAAALRYHLCLQVPKQGTAKISVAGEWITYAEGEDYLFDDTYEHTVEVTGPPNDDVRIVLFMDIIRDTPEPMNLLLQTLSRNVGFANFVKNVNANGETQLKIEA